MPCCGFPWFSSSSDKTTPVEEIQREKVRPEEPRAVLTAPIDQSNGNSGNPEGHVDAPAATIPPADASPLPHLKNGIHQHDLGASITQEDQNPSTEEMSVNTSPSSPPPVTPPVDHVADSSRRGPTTLKDGKDVIVMVVMGATGVGKTSFITSLTASYDKDERAHHNLEAGTQGIELHEVTLSRTDGDLKLILVDTPGFDDPIRPNAKVLEIIAKWLEESYRGGKMLDGMIYLHRITDIRFDAGASSTLNIFRKIYGGEGYSKLALVTTMWNDVPPTRVHEYETRENELKNIHWGPYIHRDDRALVSRYNSTTSTSAKQDAIRVVTDLLQQSVANPHLLKLKLQQELVDQNTPLPRTEAGKAVFTLSETAKFYLNRMAG